MLSNPEKNEQPVKIIKITKHLSVGLFDSGRIFTMVDGVPLVQCRKALIATAEDDPRLDEYKNMDEFIKNRSATEKKMDTNFKMEPELELFAHASNIQGWVKTGYNIDVIDSVIAIPILKMLKDVDPKARNACYFEVTRRWMEGNMNTRTALYETSPQLIEEMVERGSFPADTLPPTMVYDFIVVGKNEALKRIGIENLRKASLVNAYVSVKESFKYLLNSPKKRDQDEAYGILRKRYSDAELKSAIKKMNSVRAWRRFLTKEEFTSQMKGLKFSTNYSIVSMLGMDDEFDAFACEKLSEQIYKASDSVFVDFYFEVVDSKTTAVFGKNFLRSIHIENADFRIHSERAAHEAYNAAGIEYSAPRGSGLVIGIGKPETLLPGGMKLGDFQHVAHTSDGEEIISIVADLSGLRIYIVDESYMPTRREFVEYMKKLTRSDTGKLLAFVISETFLGNTRTSPAKFFFLPMEHDWEILSSLVDDYSMESASYVLSLLPGKNEL